VGKSEDTYTNFGIINDLIIVIFPYRERPLDPQIFMSFFMVSRFSIKFFSRSNFVSQKYKTPRALIASFDHFILIGFISSGGSYPHTFSFGGIDH